MPDIGQFVPRPSIDQVSRATESELARRLPDGESSVPNGASLQLELPGVLFQPSLEQSLRESVRPEISDRTLLTPESFREALIDARGKLESLAREAGNETTQQRFQEAAQVLDADRQLRDLLNSNLIALQRA